jgi:hypothetical protein
VAPPRSSSSVGRNDDDAVIVGEHQIAGPHQHATTRHRSIGAGDLQPRPIVDRPRAGCEHGKAQRADPVAVAGVAVADHPDGSAPDGSSREKLAPERASRRAAGGDHDDRPGSEAIDEGDSFVVGIVGVVVDRRELHRGRPPGRARPGRERHDGRIHNLVSAANAVK